MKKSKILNALFLYLIIFQVGFCFGIVPGNSYFIKTREQLEKISHNKNVVIVASTGRSGSTMLYDTLLKQTSFTLNKTHLLAPNAFFKGRIIFIFSSPDKAIESALHFSLINPQFGKEHIEHMETSDEEWLHQIKDSTHQTISHNLLCYDALGCKQHLSKWLFEETTPCTVKEAQILAIKYEDLWEESTIEAIKSFLLLDKLTLPVKKIRGCKPEKLCPEELIFRSTYNLGTLESPRYAAYDEARALWEAAPSFQFLKIIK